MKSALLLYVILFFVALTSTGCSNAAAQESWLDDLPVEVIAEPVPDDVPDSEPFINPLVERVDALESKLDGIADSLGELAVSIAKLAEVPKPVAMPMPQAACECDCDCPNIDEIRQVVREELQAVLVEMRNVKGETKTFAVPITTGPQTIVKSLSVPSDGGWYVTAIDGVPCEPKQVQTASGPVISYATPAYEMRVLNRAGQVLGAVKNAACLIVNGVRICN